MNRAAILFLLCCAASISGQLRLVKDISPGSAASNPQAFVLFQRKAYFAATNAASGREIWSSDGTTNGTKLAVDLVAGSGSSSPTAMTVLGNKMIIVATTPATGYELFESGGTAATTKLLKDITPGTGGTSFGVAPLPAYLSKPIAGKIFFAIGGDLWRTDGTTGGTKQVATVPGFRPQVLPDFAELPNKPGSFLFLVGFPGVVHVYDAATGKATSLIAPAIGASRFFTWEGKVLFTSGGFARGPVFQSDGTVAGTKIFITQSLSALQSRRDTFVGVNVASVYESDGTNAGTKLVGTAPGASVLGSAGTPAGHHFAYFTGGLPSGLWRSDATAAGTTRISSQAISAPGILGGEAVRVGRYALYGAAPNATSRDFELYSLDANAIAFETGNSCGSATRKPTMTATDPVLGTTQTIRLENIKNGSFGVLILGFPKPPPVDLGHGCEGWLNAALPFVTVPWLQQSGTTHTISAPVPNAPELLGLFLGMQAFVLPTDAPNGFDVTNAVLEVFGK